jgi:formylglycine-generating enzyme required for sulfatase activity
MELKMKKGSIKKSIWILLSVLFLGLLVYSCSEDNATSPVNRSPAVPSNASPADNATDISITPELSWQCSDPDGNPLTYNVYLGTDSENPALASEGQSAANYTPSELMYETTYYWRIVAMDDQNSQTGSAIWSFTTIAEPNDAPGAPSNPNPADNAVDVSVTATLSWQCSDPDGDDLTYDVYLGTANDNLTLMSEEQSATSYVPSELDFETVYYWKVVASDDQDIQTEGAVWSFTTSSEPNTAPAAPSNPVPANEAAEVAIDASLSWECSDPDGDDLTYNVYFGTASDNLTLVSEGQSTTNYTPSELAYETAYYWQVVATDNHSNQTPGEIWSFTTIAEANQPPTAPHNPTPYDNMDGVATVLLFLVWECEDPDDDTLTYDIYFGLDENNLELIGSVYHDWNFLFYEYDTLDYQTDYYWQVIAKDDHDHQTPSAIWAFTTAAEHNDAPNAPSDPVPANEATDVAVDVSLSWECSDPDGDIVMYDIYFGTASDNLLVISEEQTATSYNLSTLAYETTYYWQVIANDNHANQTNGDIWSFTTMPEQHVEIQWCNIPRGEYTSGPDNEIKMIEYEYEIMKYEVTNWQFAQYLNEAVPNGDFYIAGDTLMGFWEGNDIVGIDPGYYAYVRAITDGLWIDWDGEKFVIQAGKDDFPAADMTWIGANGFAKYYGWRLPTAAEWEKAARGNTGWDYSFGEAIDASRANYRLSNDPYENEGHHASTPVGFYNGERHNGFETTDSPSPYGAYDMTGNVWEYSGTWPLNLGNVSIFGHSLYDYHFDQMVWKSVDVEPLGDAADNIGFRCARGGGE